MNNVDIRIFSYDKTSWKSKLGIWNITEEELDKECCIYNSAIYWKEGIPDNFIVKKKSNSSRCMESRLL